MKSVTKTTISETSVFDAVRKHFPSTISVRAEELKGGAFNTAYLVRSEGSPSLRGAMKIGCLLYTYPSPRDAVRSR